MTARLMTAALAIAVMLPLAAARGQQPSTGLAAKPAYVPGLAEFMTFAQIRHAKLWLAGAAGNWELADYQIDELKEGLEDTAKLVPTYKNMPIGKMMESIMDAPIADVEKVIKAKDRTKFAVAFDRLTVACNACHQATNRGFIVIQRPSNSAFPNQSFAAPRQ